LLPGGTLSVWGDNSSGQRNVPGGLASVTQIAAGGKHTVALKAIGTLSVWGDNSSGQCNVPAGLTEIPLIQVAAGELHTVALTPSGEVWAWGDNSAGQCAGSASLQAVSQISAGCLGRFNLAISATATTLMEKVAAGASANAALLVANAALESQVSGLQSQVAATQAEVSACETAKAAVTTQSASRGNGDVNDDGTVGEQDLQKLLLNWGASSSPQNSWDLKEISRSINSALKAIKQSRRPG
jgi:hypothetical protein